MGDERNDDINRRRRPIPVPLYDDRYVERPYLKKVELARIRDNLDVLVDIKEELANKDVDKVNIDKISNTKSNDNKVVTSELDVQSIMNTSPSGGINNIKSEIPKSEVIDNNAIISNKVIETKVPEVKIGIGNLVDKQIVDRKNIDKKTENKSKNRKVIRMSDETQEYNVSPEMRRQIIKSEMENYHNEKEVQEAIKKTALLSEQNKKELEEIKKNLATENAEIRKDLKNEFGNKFNELSGKFADVNGKFDGVSKKLEETCTGIDCLKKDLANINKNMDLVECPECGKKIVPPLSSYCPNCNAKMYSWTEDDGVTPVKGWKPSWEEK